MLYLNIITFHEMRDWGSEPPVVRTTMFPLRLWPRDMQHFRNESRLIYPAARTLLSFLTTWHSTYFYRSLIKFCFTFHCLHQNIINNCSNIISKLKIFHNNESPFWTLKILWSKPKGIRPCSVITLGNLNLHGYQTTCVWGMLELARHVSLVHFET